jgi:RNA polymerase sigma factor (sigma-70 family)
MAADHPDAELESLVERYAALIRRVVAQVAGSRDALLGDDVQQRVLVALWRQIQREQTIQHPASYIYRIAVRETVRAVRAEMRASGAAIPDDLASPDADPHRAAAGRDQVEEIERSIGSLKPDRRRAVRAHLAGFTVEEVMRTYGWGYQTARNLIARGMNDLRKRLRARGIDG